MPRKRCIAKTKADLTLRCLQPNAAGVDVGATQIHVSVPPDRDPRPVRCFATFTADLHAAVDWLQKCQIDSVLMEL
jgi:transposase